MKRKKHSRHRNTRFGKRHLVAIGPNPWRFVKEGWCFASLELTGFSVPLFAAYIFGSEQDVGEVKSAAVEAHRRLKREEHARIICIEVKQPASAALLQTHKTLYFPPPTRSVAASSPVDTKLFPWTSYPLPGIALPSLVSFYFA